MLGVDGAELAAAGVGGRADQRTGHDDDFFVGERDIGTATEGGEGWFEAGATRGADDEHVAVGVGGHVVHRADFCAHVTGDGLEFGRRSAVGVGCGPEVAGAEFAGLSFEQGEVASGGEAEDAVALGHRADDIKGLGADAAGGAEQDEGGLVVGRVIGHVVSRVVNHVVMMGR